MPDRFEFQLFENWRLGLEHAALQLTRLLRGQPFGDHLVVCGMPRYWQRRRSLQAEQQQPGNLHREFDSRYWECHGE